MDYDYVSITLTLGQHTDRLRLKLVTAISTFLQRLEWRNPETMSFTGGWYRAHTVSDSDAGLKEMKHQGYFTENTYPHSLIPAISIAPLKVL